MRSNAVMEMKVIDIYTDNIVQYLVYTCMRIGGCDVNVDVHNHFDHYTFQTLYGQAVAFRLINSRSPATPPCPCPSYYHREIIRFRSIETPQEVL